MANISKPEDERCEKHYISFQPQDYKDAIRWCEIEERSLSWLIRKALREYMEKHPAR